MLRSLVGILYLLIPLTAAAESRYATAPKLERRFISRKFAAINFFGRRTVTKRIVPGLVRAPRSGSRSPIKNFAPINSVNLSNSALNLKLPEYLSNESGQSNFDGSNFSRANEAFGNVPGAAAAPSFNSPNFSGLGIKAPQTAHSSGGSSPGGGGNSGPGSSSPMQGGLGGSPRAGLRGGRGGNESDSDNFTPRSATARRLPGDVSESSSLPQTPREGGPFQDVDSSANPTEPTSSSASGAQPTKFDFAFLHENAQGISENRCGGTPAGKQSRGDSCSFAFFLAAHCVEQQFTSMRLKRSDGQEPYHTVPRESLELIKADGGIDAALITFNASCDYVQDHEIAKIAPIQSDGGPGLASGARVWTKNQDGYLIQGAVNPNVIHQGKDSIVADEISGPHSRPGDSGSPIWSSQGLVGTMTGGSAKRLDFSFSRLGTNWLTRTLLEQGFQTRINHGGAPVYGSHLASSGPDAMTASKPGHVSSNGARPSRGRDIASLSHAETSFQGTTDPKTGFRNAILPQLVPYTQGEHRMPAAPHIADPSDPLRSAIKNCIACHKAGSGRKLILPDEPDAALEVLKNEMKRNCGFVSLQTIFKMAESNIHGKLNEEQKQALLSHLTGKTGDYRQIIEGEARALHSSHADAPPKIVSNEVDRFYRQLLPETQDPFMNQIFNSSDTIMYDSKSMPLIYQIGKDSFGAGEGMKRVGDINNEGILGWSEIFSNGRLRSLLGSPLGLHDTDSKDFDKFQFFKLPRSNGQLAPALWSKVASGKNSHYYDWDFPIGTTLGEAITVKNPQTGQTYVTEVRTRTKSGKDYWQADVYKPFPTRQSLVDAVKRLWSNWESIPALNGLVAKMESTQSLPVTAVSSEYGVPVYRDQAAMDALPTLPPEIVSRLLSETPFRSALNQKWVDNGTQVGFAPTSQADFGIVPKNYAAHTTEISSESCMRCHQNARTNFGTLFPGATRNDGAVNAPPDAYGASYGSSSRIMTWHPFDDSAVAAGFASGSVYNDNRERNGMPNLRRSFVDSGILMHQSQVPRGLEGCY